MPTSTYYSNLVMQGASSVNSEMKKRLVKDFSNSLL